MTPTAPTGGYTTITNIANGTLKAYSGSYGGTNSYYKLDTIKVGGKKINTLQFGSASGGYTHLQVVEIITQTEKAAGCSNNVGVTKGTENHGEITTISSASVATCSATASDRRVTITVTPDDCYDAPSTLTWTKSSGTVSASKQSGPTDNGDGTYSYVYQFAQNDNGAGTFGVTCTAKAAGKTVNFDAGPGSCLTSSLTETCDGSGVTLPAVTATGVCKGWTTFAGWATAAVSDSTTTSVTVYAAGSNFVPASDGQTLYAVYSKAKGGSGFKLSLTVSSTTYYVGKQHGSDNYLSAETNSANAAIFTFDNGYLSYDDSGTKKYISITGNNTSLYTTTAKPAVTWTESGTTTYTYLTSAATRYLAYNGSASPVRFASYNNNSSYPQYFTKTSTATTYYCSDPNCASCSADPSAGTASLNGSFSLTSVGVTATDWDPGTNCTWDEKGFVWGSSANPTVSNNKVTVNTGTSATWDGALVPSGSTDPTSLSVGNTYHYRAYGKNGKEGATYVYSSDASFTPRSVTCESVTGGTISAGTEVSVSGKTITLTATPDSHFSFGSWTVTNNSTSATITVTNNQFTMPDANVTVTATFNEDAYKTVTFYNNSTNTGITGYTNMKVYVGDTPSEPTLTDGTSGDACDATSDKHYGWSRDTWSGTIDTEAHMTGSPGNHTVYQKGSVPAVVAGDPATISYHAVWAAGSQYWGRLTSSTLSGLATGDRIVIVSTVDGRSGALQSITKTNDNEGVAIAAVPTETNNQISNPSSDIIWTLNANSTNWEIKSGDDKLGSKYTNCPNRVGTGILVQKGTNWTTWTFGSSSSGTDMIYIKNQGTTDCQLGLGIVTASSVNTWRAIKQTTVSSSSDCALKVYKEFGSYSTFLTTCCTTPTLAFAASPYAVIRQDIQGASTTTWAEVDVTFTSTNTTGTISATTYTDSKTVYKMSSWQSRSTTDVSALCATNHAYFEVLTQPSGATPGTGKFHVKTTTGQTGQGTYRIAITQAATDESHGNFCETTAYGFVDVTLRDKFVDKLNDNGTVNKDGHGAQLATPALSELGTQVENACHSEGRKLKGWIKETDLKSKYETGNSERVQTIDGLCETCDDATDWTSLIVAPGTNVTMSGATWYAVWAYER
ncbi:MAG: hypothetical protein IJ204_07395 [Paludibacteraceae bacterium]|nr:hypothetical protein [Paludibacteraceae bacterium]